MLDADVLLPVFFALCALAILEVRAPGLAVGRVLGLRGKLLEIWVVLLLIGAAGLFYTLMRMPLDDGAASFVAADASTEQVATFLGWHIAQAVLFDFLEIFYRDVEILRHERESIYCGALTALKATVGIVFLTTLAAFFFPRRSLDDGSGAGLISAGIAILAVYALLATTLFVGSAIDHVHEHYFLLRLAGFFFWPLAFLGVSAVIVIYVAASPDHNAINRSVAMAMPAYLSLALVGVLSAASRLGGDWIFWSGSFGDFSRELPTLSQSWATLHIPPEYALGLEQIANVAFFDAVSTCGLDNPSEVVTLTSLGALFVLIFRLVLTLSLMSILEKATIGLFEPRPPADERTAGAMRFALGWSLFNLSVIPVMLPLIWYYEVLSEEFWDGSFLTVALIFFAVSFVFAAISFAAAGPQAKAALLPAVMLLPFYLFFYIVFTPLVGLIYLGYWLDLKVSGGAILDEKTGIPVVDG